MKKHVSIAFGFGRTMDATRVNGKLVFGPPYWMFVRKQKLTTRERVRLFYGMPNYRTLSAHYTYIRPARKLPKRRSKRR